MLSYYVELFARALFAIPGLLGSNALGVVFPVLIVICGELIALLVYGRKVMIEKLRKASIIGFVTLVICYTLLFVWCAMAANYSQYAELNSRIGPLQTAYDTNAANEKYAVLQAQLKCAETIGENKNLEKQNRGQQNTINNCQTQGLKLLTPEKPILRSFMASPMQKSSIPSMAYVLTTNVTRATVDLVVNCDFPISRAGLSPMSNNDSTVFTGNARPITANKWELSMLSPAWSSAEPLWVNINLVPPVDRMPTCTFESQ